MSNYIRQRTYKVIAQPSREDQVVRQVHRLDQTNKKLLSVAEAITKTSFLQQRQVPAVICEFQHQIRGTLDELISNIKDYYIDIDNKMKSLCLTIGNNYGVNPQSFDPTLVSPQQIHLDPLRQLSEKVDSLQNSLKKTQENQKKLVQIIQCICQKHQISQQPTLIKNDPYLRQCFEMNRASTNTQEKLQKNSSQQFSIHEKLNGLIQSKVEELKFIEEPRCYIRKIYSKGNSYLQAYPSKPQSVAMTEKLNPPHNYIVKKSLKSNLQCFQESQLSEQRAQTQNRSESLQHSHRFNFLMRRLNENPNQSR